MDLSLSGLASGFDWKSVVDQIADVERAPQRRLRSEQDKINQRKSAVASLVSELETLQTKAQALEETKLFSGAGSAASSNTDYATATASENTPSGTYKFTFTQLAEAAFQTGSSDVGGPIDPTAALNDAGFPVAVSTGFFTINGKQYTVTSSSTVDSIIADIKSQDASLNNAGTLYDAASDTITLNSSGSPIILGGSGDTSNFLQVARLNNNGAASTTITSSTKIGGVSLGAQLSAVTALSAASGTFKINGVTLSYSSTETVSDLLSKISSSAAGVSASYDSVNDRFLLTNKSTGDIGIALEDVTGNFLAATKISTGTTTDGQNAQFTINGGAVLESLSNTITEVSHGITGLSVTALKETDATVSSVTVTVGTNKDTIKKAISDFTTQYNKVQSLIDTQTASTTDADGKVTSGILAADTLIASISSDLRSATLRDGPGSLQTIKRFDAIGYTADGFHNTLSQTDSTKIDDALLNLLSEVKTLFTDSTDGIGTRVDALLERLVGDDGSLVSHKDTFVKQSSRIDDQITDMEKQVQFNRQRMIDSFLAMEKAQAQVNQQMQFLAQRFK